MAQSWIWYSPDKWPSYTDRNQSVIGKVANGLKIAPHGTTKVDWTDANKDGIISDADTDDRMGSNGDTVRVNDVTRTVKEIGRYTNCTITAGGQTYTVNIAVTVFTDGTYGTRLIDGEFPKGLNMNKVEGIRLGTWDGREYTGVYVSAFDDQFVCFADGTRIETPDGPVPIETLRPGMLVTTVDHGPRPVIWTGCRTVPGTGPMAPILIRKGALGNAADIRVSPQHRVLVTGWRAELMFGAAEVLVPAMHLTNGTTIIQSPCPTVTYTHLLFDRHQIILSDGLASESFHPGAVALDRLGQTVRDEILTIFPELLGAAVQARTARRCLSAREARVLLAS
jgi:Hint domain